MEQVSLDTKEGGEREGGRETYSSSPEKSTDSTDGVFLACVKETNQNIRFVMT